jgi:L-aspartate oxidase
VHSENELVHERPSDFTICHDEADPFTDLQQHISSLLSRYAGIYRDKGGLEYALHQMNELAGSCSGVQSEYFSIRSEGLIQLAEMIVKAALQREESRGVHIRSDFPEHEPAAHHILF